MDKNKRLELIVNLTIAKVEILKMQADDYNWQVHVPENSKEQLIKTLEEIDEQLLSLNSIECTKQELTMVSVSDCISDNEAYHFMTIDCIGYCDKCGSTKKYEP